MRLETVRTALEQQLRSPSTDHAYLAGRRRHAVLADFDRPGEAITFLNSRGHEGCQRRSAVTAAMIAEAQRRETGTWSALLMLAYFPGLLSIRSTMKPSAGLGCDELRSHSEREWPSWRVPGASDVALRSLHRGSAPWRRR